MRTTLDISNDVLQAAKERARREQKTIGAVISELARRALNSTDTRTPPASPRTQEPKAVYGFRAFPKRGGIVTNDAIDRLREDGVY